MNNARPTPLTAPLDGRLLVEASAGTGKTYTLTTLAARLVVEAGHSIENLLIVTFTVAATGELRTRIWQTLYAARDAVRDATAAANDQARELAAHWRRAGIADAEARLTRAIRDFDRANITTIHGFCQRALAEFALHAKLPFAFSVSGDAALEVESATRDFWRRRMVQEPVALLEYAKQQKFVLDEAATWTGQHHAKPSVMRPEADPDGSMQDSRPEREDWAEAFRATHDAWSDPAQRQTFHEVIERYQWKKGSKDDSVCRAVIEALDANDAGLLSLKDAGYFAPMSLANKLFKKNPPPDIPLYACFERLGEAATELGEAWLSGQRRGLLVSARETLHRGTWAARRLSFDALLTQLHRALGGAGGDALAARMRTRYPVALIDEFQDTDRLQAQIFERIYATDHRTGGLIVVGDPKQSIYRFRGADVFAYLDAKTRVTAGHTLDLTVNYRSDPALVRAVNVTFGRDNPFLLPDIRFEAAHAAAHDGGALCVQDEEHDPKPFQLHLFPEDEGKKWGKGELTRAAAEHAAGRIVRLLELGASGKALVRRASGPAAGIPLVAGNIAVLVRTGKQGRAVAHALRQGGVRTVELGTDSVFDSAEAAAAHQLLHGQETRAASERHVRGLSAADWLAEVRQFGERAADEISISVAAATLAEGSLPAARPKAESESLVARRLHRQLARIRQLTSYSALASGAGAEESPGEHEATYVDPEPAPDDVRNEFTFPAGTRPGNCLHEILAQRLQPNGNLEGVRRDALAKWGIDPQWIEVARTMVTTTLNTPLLPDGGGNAGTVGIVGIVGNGNTFRLGDVDQPIAEMQFHLPIRGFRRGHLTRALNAHGYDPRLADGAGEINGFLNGFIDVVARVGERWYVMDYKSNWLGNDAADYSPEAIERAMAQHGYHLQYLLYVTALHRLLRIRLPDYDYDRHVGGAFYLFLRGMRPQEPGSGVYRDRPSRACIEAIDACFRGGAS